MESVRVGCYVLMGDEERILLCRICEQIPEVGFWTLPGGGLDFGEQPADGAIREVFEETGLTVTLGEIAGIRSTVLEGQGARMHSLQIIYRAVSFTGDMRPEVNGSTDCCAWFSREEANQLQLVQLAKEGIALYLG